jgi:hypothetical protein
MARTKIDRMEALKNFVETLKAKYPNAKSYDRATVDEVRESNPTGFLAFACGTTGYGKMTRLSRGMYVIPASWENGSAPWEATTSKQSASSNA